MELVAVINGAQQVPANNSPATGTFAGTYTSINGVKQLKYTVTFKDMSPNTAPSSAHIHEGAPGKTGVVIIPFTPAPGTTLSSPITGMYTLSDVQAENLLSNKMYVNIHSRNQPSYVAEGEIRGDIKRK
ncbi:MAG TPA: CHRD domain-containing protein [Hymenobacter sp.]|uniref:CHRD domain-containing protein n=1 Tax=Hymenobacter sp. TaxID=1898978 RepID=UPI002ED84F05